MTVTQFLALFVFVLLVAVVLLWIRTIGVRDYARRQGEALQILIRDTPTRTEMQTATERMNAIDEGIREQRRRFAEIETANKKMRAYLSDVDEKTRHVQFKKQTLGAYDLGAKAANRPARKRT